MKKYTPTQISTYEICPKKYQFKYINRLRKPARNVESFMGTIVHETLAKLYKDLLLSKKNSIKEMLFFFSEKWKEKWHSGICIPNKEFTERHYFLTGEQCIKDYYNQYSPFDQGKTIGLEMKVEIPLNSTGRTLVGFIDRLVYLGNGHFEIHDYKVSTSLPDLAKVEQVKQFPFSQLAINEMWQDVNKAGLIWHFLVLDKELSFTKSSDTLEDLRNHLTNTIDAIESTSDFHPVESRLCQECDYKHICPLWKHLLTVESLPITKNNKEEGVSLVNRFVALMEKKKLINDELQKIKTAVSEFADNEGVENIFGTDYKLSVRKEKRFKFPSLSKDTAKMKELEEWLKKNKKWNDVSKVDFTALENVLKEAAWKEKPLNKLKDFAIVEKRAYVSSSKLNEEE